MSKGAEKVQDAGARVGMREDRWGWVTWGAFVGTLAIVGARAMMLEVGRDPFEVMPGSEATVRDPGVATSVALDLLACVPGLLVLLRWAVDRTYKVRWVWSAGIVLLFGAWAAASSFWAADRFAAAVGAAHVLSAAVVFWAMTQLVRSWLRLRLVAAVALGVLLVLLARGFSYRFIDVPELRQAWQHQRQQVFQERGWAADSFEARQFEKRVLGGEVFGFTASPNSFAAELVLLGTIGAGMLIERVSRNRGERPSPRPSAGVPGEGERGGSASRAAHRTFLSSLAIGIALGLTVWIGWYTQSRTALVTAVLAGVMLASVGMMRAWLGRHARLAYGIGVGVVVVGMGAVIGHGLRHGSLVLSSLTFRWWYWVGAARVFAQHVLTGVGWDNFSWHYLAARLPQASEEIHDPHNFLVRAAVELGIVGAALMVGWMLRLWWEMTRPVTPSAPRVSARQRAMPVLLSIAGLTMLINVLGSVDFSLIEASSEKQAYLILEICRRVIYAGALVVGMALAGTRRRSELEDGPAPWVLYGMVIGLGLFLLHNLIDFSLFETGPLFLFMLLSGSVVGVRQAWQVVPQRAEKTTAAEPAEFHSFSALRHSLEQRKQTLASSGPQRRVMPGVVLGLGLAAWLAAGVGFVLPIVQAETQAQQADESLRSARFAAAAAQFKEAYFSTWPRNSDYAYRSARALIFGGAAPNEVRGRLALAIAANPLDVRCYLTRANYALSQKQMPAAAEDLQRAVMLDPNDVGTRLRYADVLAEQGKNAEAREQYGKALSLNEQLEKDDPKRLTSQQVERLPAKVGL